MMLAEKAADLILRNTPLAPQATPAAEALRSRSTEHREPPAGGAGLTYRAALHGPSEVREGFSSRCLLRVDPNAADLAF